MTNLSQKFTALHKESLYYPYSDAAVFNAVIEKLAAPFKNKGITKVVGLEARGFLLAGAVARELKCGCIFVRKAGSIEKIDYKPKYRVLQRTFFDYSGKQKSLELESDPYYFRDDDRYLIVDDWIATGSQLKAAVEMIEEVGIGEIVGLSVIINSAPENFRLAPNYSFLKKYVFKSIVSL